MTRVNRVKSKKLGQCFLNSHEILRKEASAADVAGKSVIEIGAGDGRLTQKILEAKAGKIIAVEKDKNLAKTLRERFFGENKVEIVEGDFLEVELPTVDRIVGNIPYYISSPILFHLVGMQWGKALLMVQKEFADKMLAKPNEKNYGRLSVTAQLAFGIQYIQTVPRRFFTPRPRVDSAMILLRPTGLKLGMDEQDIIRFLFQHKNQTVRNALKHSKKFDVKQIEKLGEFAQRRARTLRKEECLEIADKLKNS